MQAIIPGLYASDPEPLPFAPALHVRAFLLQREPGNLLVYSTSELGSEAEAIEELGGISRQYLNHRHEAGFASEWVTSPLFVHEDEREAVAEKTAVDESFSARHTLDDDFEVVPTPGHTPGATAFLWSSAEHRVLLRATRSIWTTASGSRQCSTSATGPRTSRAWSSSGSSTSTGSCPGPRAAASRTTR